MKTIRRRVSDDEMIEHAWRCTKPRWYDADGRLWGLIGIALQTTALVIICLVILNALSKFADGAELKFDQRWYPEPIPARTETWMRSERFHALTDLPGDAIGGITDLVSLHQLLQTGPDEITICNPGTKVHFQAKPVIRKVGPHDWLVVIP